MRFDSEHLSADGNEESASRYDCEFVGGAGEQTYILYQAKHCRRYQATKPGLGEDAWIVNRDAPIIPLPLRIQVIPSQTPA